MDVRPCWHYDDILALFKQHGIARFEPLQIWHLPELKRLFVESCSRAPVSKMVKVSRPYSMRLRRIIKSVLPPVAISALRKIMGR
jgi:hypothetical protein